METKTTKQETGFIVNYQVWVKGDGYVIVDSETDKEVSKIYKSHWWCCEKAANMNWEYNYRF